MKIKLIEVLIPADLEQFLTNQVESGEANAISEVIHEALYLLQDHNELRRIKKERLRKEIEKGMEGERIEATKEFWDKLRCDLRERQAERMANSWLTVKDHSPEKDCMALVAAGEQITLADWTHTKGWQVSREDKSIGITGETITHWLPLPYPPISLT